MNKQIELYEMTFTLKPKYNERKAKDQFEKTKFIILDILSGLKKTIIAELTMNCNVHYHCLVEMFNDIETRNSIIDRIRRWNRDLGRYSFFQVQYEMTYKKYMIKDLIETRKILGDPIVTDDFAICSIQFLEDYEESNFQKIKIKV